jgi:hypothetical protein
LTSVGFYSDRDETGVTPPNNPLLTESTLYAPFNDQNIWDDIQLCATHVDATTRAVSGGQIAAESGLGGSSPGSSVTTVAIRTPSRGTLALADTIGGFTCWDGVQGDNRLVFEIGATHVDTLNRSGENYLAQPFELDIRSLAVRSGIAFEDGNRVTMNVRRIRDACDDRLWGADDHELLRIHMDIEGPQGLVITHNMPDTVNAGDTVDLEVKVEMIDQFGVGSFEDGVTVNLSAAAGSATVDPASGETDVNGIFNTQVFVAPDPLPTNRALEPEAQLLVLSIIASGDGVDTTEVVESVLKSCVYSSLVANSQEELDAFDGVCRVENILQLGDDGSGTKINNLDALSNLMFAGAIAIDNTDLTSLDGLETVTMNSTSSLSILNNASLTNIDSLGSRAGIGVRSFVVLQIKNNPVLTSIGGVDNIIRPIGAEAFYLEIVGNSSLGSLSGLDRVTTVGSLLNIEDNDALTALTGLSPLNVATLTIDGNATLTSLSSLIVTAVTDSIAIRDNAALPNLDGLGRVTSLSDGCEISGNAELSDINGLQGLTTVGGLFAITKNPKLCTFPVWVNNVVAGSTDFSDNGTDPSCSPPAN